MNHLSVNIRLFLLVGLLSLVSIVVGLMGLRGMSETVGGLRTVYEDRVVPLRDLKVIADLYAVNIVDMTHKVRNGNIDWAEARKNLQDARQGIQKTWTAYKATFLVEEEKKLVASIEPMLAEAEASINQLQTILEDEDRKAIARYTIDTLYPVIDPISTKFSELIEVQLNVAKAEYLSSREQYEQSKLISILLLTGGTLAGILLAWRIVGSVVNPLRLMQETAQRVSLNFDYASRIEVTQNDEVGQTAHAFNTLLQAQQTAVGQVNAVVQHLANGNLDQRIEGDMRGDLAVMKSAINNSLDTVQQTMRGFNGLSQALLHGQFDHTIDASLSRGEFRESLQQASVALQALHRMIGNVDGVMGAVASGDLTQRVDTDATGDLLRLKRNINSSLEALGQALGAVHNSTRQVAAAANQTSTAIGQISDGAQNQTHAIGQVALAIKHTAESVTDVSRNTAIASQKSRESMAIMQTGMGKMGQMVQVVNNISVHSDKINKITEVIEKIANKTNLLSLNAAIEAARAGEHGKGFSVVAEEVGKLAASSAESSQEIGRLVQQAVAETAHAVQVVQEVSRDMSMIEQGSQQTDQMLQRISSALEQQSAAVEEINSNLGSLDRIAISNASASEEITATVMELSKLAEQTRQDLGRFRV
ncbi:methyl-accepting chemotaxis protein [Limnohabitans sp. yimb22184]|uniref:HAMP domain-containing methyl-accepting chemotaxis protein n=1 Tax=Limnohabitans sp. YIMB22184 TaxID=3374104 RepID=UPI003A8B3528